MKSTMLFIRLALILTTFLSSFSAFAQTVSVTFQVDMSNETLSSNGVHIAGNFQEAAELGDDWNPGSTMLDDADGDQIYAITVNVPSGTYEYKYINGNGWGADEGPVGACSVGPNNNRIVTIGNTDLVLEPMVFDECTLLDQTNFETYWWNDAVFYELFVRSFYDSDGDGIGDFQGIVEKLDYLNDGDPETETDLGITALWLMPMMASPSYHGYDVTDYYATESDYGTMEDFEALLEATHARGIKVIIDLVLNHSSTQHPWFTQSADAGSDFRDWYVWSDTDPGYNGPWGQDVWHSDGGDFYYGLFWGGMPDLNYTHQPLKDEMFNVIDFWLAKGVDGFRLDAVKYLIEDGSILENTPATFTLLEEINDVYTADDAETFAIGEVWSNTSSIIPYVQNERLDACFEFDLAGAILNAVNGGNASSVREQMQGVQASYPALQYGTFLTNHDMDRVYNQLGSNTGKVKLAAAIYLTLPGVPFLYYGEELNMVGTGDHLNIRRPMQWSGAGHAGFSAVSPWNNVGSNYVNNNVAIMEADGNSLLNHYKKLIHIRNGQAALRKGNYFNVEGSVNNVLSFMRVHEDKAVVVASNLGTTTATPALTLESSTLGSGLYHVIDLYDNQEMGTIVINGNGGFVDWSPSPADITSRTTRIMLLSIVVNDRNLGEKEISFQVSPNPARAEVKIHWEGAAFQGGEVTVVGANGGLVYEAWMHDDVSLVLDTKGWEKGVYFVQVMVDGELGVRKLVVL